jgi:hypothetical protein
MVVWSPLRWWRRLPPAGVRARSGADACLLPSRPRRWPRGEHVFIRRQGTPFLSPLSACTSPAVPWNMDSANCTTDRWAIWSACTCLVCTLTRPEPKPGSQPCLANALFMPNHRRAVADEFLRQNFGCQIWPGMSGLPFWALAPISPIDFLSSPSQHRWLQ